ncbi:MAG: GGDEF domain-containing protein [Pseudomonadota bacterium]
MFTLDLRTVILLSSVMSALMSIVLFSAYRSFPSSIQGLGRWSAGSLLLFVTAILIGLRGMLPDWLSILVGNAAMLVAIGLWLTGTQQFYGRRPSWGLALLILIAGICGVAWFGLVQPDFQARVVLVTALLSLLYGTQFYLVARYGGPHSGTYFFGGMMLLQTLVVTMRCLTGLSPDMRDASMYTGDLMQSIYLASYYFTSTTLAVGFMMIATQRLQAELARSSSVDALTDALNRRAFAVLYENETKRMKRHGHPMSLIIMDLDYFKRINDQYGHVVGDKVLIHFSSTVIRLLREIDHFSRFGGEEFVALLPETTVDEAQAVAERIYQALRQARDAEIPPYTVSMGIAGLERADESLDSVVGRADAALYRAKSAGRDRLEVTAARDEEPGEGSA